MMTDNKMRSCGDTTKPPLALAALLLTVAAHARTFPSRLVD
jgi:hypothetical protein